MYSLVTASLSQGSPGTLHIGLRSVVVVVHMLETFFVFMIGSILGYYLCACMLVRVACLGVHYILAEHNIYLLGLVRHSQNSSYVTCYCMRWHSLVHMCLHV